MPQRFTRLTRWAFGLLLILSLLACGAKEQVTVLKLAHGLSQTHPTHRAMTFMAQRLKELSGGTMRIDIYPAGQLGDEQALLELLQIGSLAMTKASASPLESFEPAFKIFSLPYIFRDEHHFWQTLSSDIGAEILHKGDAVRLHGLTYYDAGSRSFYTTTRPIHSPADLKGLKIRVQKSITSLEMIEALGASATPIDWGELYTALQQGVVDGAENNAATFYLSKHYEVCRYFTLDEHTFVPDILLISLPIWQRLTPQQQAWLQQAADDSSVYQRKIWREETTASLIKLQEEGVEIIHTDKNAFAEKVLAMQEHYRHGEIGRLIEAVQALGAEEEAPK